MEFPSDVYFVRSTFTFHGESLYFHTTQVSLLHEMFDNAVRFYENRADQPWWPTDPLEVIVGAVLVQGTKWGNVARVLDELKSDATLDFRKLLDIDPVLLEERIRPVGFQQRKVPALKALIEFLFSACKGDLAAYLARDPELIRSELLKIKGIGAQTADNILLYAANQGVYSVDKYTFRILLRHGIIGTRAKEGDVKRIFDHEFSNDAQEYNDFQAILVRIGRDFCGKSSPNCSKCPLNTLLPQGGPLECKFESVSKRVLPRLNDVSVQPLPPIEPTITPIEDLDLTEMQRKVISLIQPEGTPIDTIIAISGVPTGQVLATLSALEFQKLVRRKEGNLVART